jgi:hypothetical protein
VSLIFQRLSAATILRSADNIRSLLTGLISTVEVLSIVAVFIYTTVFPESSHTEPTEPGCPSTCKEKFFLAWSWFLFISPFCTNIFVMWMASDISCNDVDDYTIINQPICQVGIRLIKATALCRAGIMCESIHVISSLTISNLA